MKLIVKLRMALRPSGKLRSEEKVKSSHEPSRDRVRIKDQVVDFDEFPGSWV